MFKPVLKENQGGKDGKYRDQTNSVQGLRGRDRTPDHHDEETGPEGVLSRAGIPVSILRKCCESAGPMGRYVRLNYALSGFILPSSCSVDNASCPSKGPSSESLSSDSWKKHDHPRLFRSISISVSRYKVMAIKLFPHRIFFY